MREVAYEWTRSLRLLFGFRLLVRFAVCYAGDVETNRLFLFVTLLFNFYFLLYLFGFIGPGIDGGNVVQPQHTKLPKVLIMVDFLGPLFCVVYDIFIIQAG